jgi:transcriptional regulator with XRE-family HTH domain
MANIPYFNPFDKVNPMVNQKDGMTVAFNTAAAIKSLRGTTGLTQTEFARLVQMSQADLSKYESGVHSMTMRRLAEVAERIGVEISLTLAPPSTAIKTKKNPP